MTIDKIEETMLIIANANEDNLLHLKIIFEQRKQCADLWLKEDNEKEKQKLKDMINCYNSQIKMYLGIIDL